jgi:hypothetical protein
MNLIINNIEITTDGDGRFSLNDLHIAAGGEAKHKPSKFYRSHGFKDEVDFLMSRSGHLKPIVKKQGRYNGGTWVCKELVYSYAMWISPEFKVKVIQTFDDAVNSRIPTETMSTVNAIVKKIESDKQVASFCGRELANYRKIKRANEEAFKKEIKTAQLTLGFSE